MGRRGCHALALLLVSVLEGLALRRSVGIRDLLGAPAGEASAAPAAEDSYTIFYDIAEAAADLWTIRENIQLLMQTQQLRRAAAGFNLTGHIFLTLDALRLVEGVLSESLGVVVNGSDDWDPEDYEGGKVPGNMTFTQLGLLPGINDEGFTERERQCRRGLRAKITLLRQKIALLEGDAVSWADKMADRILDPDFYEEFHAFKNGVRCDGVPLPRESLPTQLAVPRKGGRVLRLGRVYRRRLPPEARAQRIDRPELRFRGRPDAARPHLDDAADAGEEPGNCLWHFQWGRLNCAKLCSTNPACAAAIWCPKQRSCCFLAKVKKEVADTSKMCVLFGYRERFLLRGSREIGQWLRRFRHLGDFAKKAETFGGFGLGGIVMSFLPTPTLQKWLSSKDHEMTPRQAKELRCRIDAELENRPARDCRFMPEGVLDLIMDFFPRKIPKEVTKIYVLMLKSMRGKKWATLRWVTKVVRRLLSSPAYQKCTVIANIANGVWKVLGEAQTVQMRVREGDYSVVAVIDLIAASTSLLACWDSAVLRTCDVVERLLMPITTQLLTRPFMQETLTASAQRSLRPAILAVQAIARARRSPMEA